MLTFDVDGETRTIEPEVLIVAGYTGASTEAVQHHIEELAAEGIAPPPMIPMYWSMPASSLSQGGVMQAPSTKTSGEIELALVVDEDDILVTAASDHTCREAEAIDIRLSKLICPTPIATTAWHWNDVADRWSELELGSEIRVGGESQPYQEAPAGGNRAPIDLLAGVPWGETMPDRFVLLCGTVPTIGGVRPSTQFSGRITDPATGRRIDLDYRINPAPALVT